MGDASKRETASSAVVPGTAHSPHTQGPLRVLRFDSLLLWEDGTTIAPGIDSRGAGRRQDGKGLLKSPGSWALRQPPVSAGSRRGHASESLPVTHTLLLSPPVTSGEPATSLGLSFLCIKYGDVTGFLGNTESKTSILT